MTTTTPTLNKVYNEILRKWAADGHNADPECEECDRDLTGQPVWETAYGWYCVECAQRDR